MKMNTDSPTTARCASAKAPSDTRSSTSARGTAVCRRLRRMLESLGDERSRPAGFTTERHSSQEAAMTPNLLTVRLDCSGLQHKRIVHFARLFTASLAISTVVTSRDLLLGEISARSRNLPREPQKMQVASKLENKAPDINMLPQQSTQRLIGSYGIWAHYSAT